MFLVIRESKTNFMKEVFAWKAQRKIYHSFFHYQSLQVTGLFFHLESFPGFSQASDFGMWKLTVWKRWDDKHWLNPTYVVTTKWCLNNIWSLYQTNNSSRGPTWHQTVCWTWRVKISFFPWGLHGHEIQY